MTRPSGTDEAPARLQVGDRVRHVRTGQQGTVTATSYPGWIDWKPDDRAEPGVMTTDPSNLRAFTNEQASAQAIRVSPYVTDEGDAAAKFPFGDGQ